jgi:putrescine transport system ATP-binding protein
MTIINSQGEAGSPALHTKFPAAAPVKLAPWQDVNAKPFVRVQGVTKTFGNVYAVDDVSVDIYQGEFFSLLGGSGCGKSTLLRILAGLEMPTSGKILIDGVDVTHTPPFERPVNMMFQSYALFPHMTVAQNIAFGLQQAPIAERRADGSKKEAPKRMSGGAIEERVRQMLALVKMEGLGARKPDQLSGGQRQRVALARALAKQPKLLLLDEPLGALDKRLREHTQFELMNIQDQIGTTFITVTHDQEEAMTMSTRVAVMNAGRIAQVNTPANLYEFPANRFVAEFIGSVNTIEGRVLHQAGDFVHITAAGFERPIVMKHTQPLPEGTPVSVAVRPEKLDVLEQLPENAMNWVRGKVTEMAYKGDVSVYHVQTASGTVLRVQETHWQRQAHPHYDWNDELYLVWEADGGAVLAG